MIGDFHAWVGWWAAGFCGAAGVAALGYRLFRRPPDGFFKWMTGTAAAVILAQTGLGLVSFWQGEDPGTIHMFYGFVILFTLAFIYIYRAQFARRPALYWGLALLFMMGLGIRGILSFGESF